MILVCARLMLAEHTQGTTGLKEGHLSTIDSTGDITSAVDPLWIQHTNLTCGLYPSAPKAARTCADAVGLRTHVIKCSSVGGWVSKG